MSVAAPALQLPAAASRGRRPYWIAALAALLLGGGWGVYALSGGRQGGTAPGIEWATIADGDLDVTVKMSGDLQAVRNRNIVSEVEGTTTIQFLAPEGATVREGEVLVKLDSSQIELKIDDARLEKLRWEADVATARAQVELQRSQNSANIEAAESALLLAELDLRRWRDGVYPQMHQNALTAVEMAEINLKNRQEDLAQTRQLASKGFVTAADVKDAELKVTTAQNDLVKAQTDLEVLTQYTYKMDEAAKLNAVSQAKQKLARARSESEIQLTQRLADLRQKESSLEATQRRLAKLEDQLAKSTIRAPEDAVVVYASSGDRNARDQIAEGVSVRERQLILRLPDVRDMMAVIRVNESVVPRLNVDRTLRAEVRIVGVPEPKFATLTKIGTMADSGSRWFNPDLKEYPVELTLDSTPPGLKPGISCQVTIFVERLKNVTMVPLQAVYTIGRTTFVFVRGAEGERPVEVKLGVANETHAHVIDGLKSGDQVMLLQAGQGKLLADKHRLQGEPVRPATNPADLGPAPASRPARFNGQDEPRSNTQGLRSGDEATHPGGDAPSGRPRGMWPRRRPEGGAPPAGE